MENLNYIDLGIITIIGISTVLAFFRGLVTEILSLAVWFIAFYVSTLFSPQVSDYLSPHLDAPFNTLAAFALTFLGCLFLGGLVNLLITMLLKRLKIVAPDRILGSFFGFARGIFVVALVVLLVEPTPLNKMPLWANSVLVPQVKQISGVIKSLIPQDLLDKMNIKDVVNSTTEKALNGAIAPSTSEKPTTKPVIIKTP